MLGKRKINGFTLIELLIVIAIIAILFAVIFVALNPLQRFQDSRDTARWQDVRALIDAIKVNQVDNGGNYISEINNMTAGEWYMVVFGDMDTGCDDNNLNCDVAVNSDANCVDLRGLVTSGYLGEETRSPSGQVSWDFGETDGQEGSGYVVKRATTSIITVQACESESTDNIKIAK